MLEILPLVILGDGFFGIGFSTHQHLPAAYSAPLVVTATAAGPAGSCGAERWPRSAEELDLEALKRRDVPVVFDWGK